MSKILVAEDDESLGYVLSEYLQMNKFEVIWVTNGLKALKVFEEEKIDLCLLDIMMPEMDGFELAKKVRDLDANIPIMFLTAKGLKIDKLKGFNLGADDYLTKPVDEEELLARIRAILRRSQEQYIDSAGAEEYSFGESRFVPVIRKLYLKEKEFSLTEKESLLLKMLLKNMNELLPRTDTLKEIWGKNDYFNRRSMDVHITQLRKILKNDQKTQIVNVHGKGFILKVIDHSFD